VSQSSCKFHGSNFSLYVPDIHQPRSSTSKKRPGKQDQDVEVSGFCDFRTTEFVVSSLGSCGQRRILSDVAREYLFSEMYYYY